MNATELFMKDGRSAGEMKAPFPWFGGKRKVAREVWERFGCVKNYVEPFFGSGAVLLGRPSPPGTETVNDLDGLVCNFWRSIKLSPDLTAEHADNPVNENDLHARHIWLVHQLESLRQRLEGDPEFHDPKIAGWWVWGISCWIGSGFCSGNGPWRLNANGQLADEGGSGPGVGRQLIHLGNAGQGVNSRHNGILNWFRALADRLRHVRVCSGDWSRVVGPSVTTKHGPTGVFLDPPYSDAASRHEDLYRMDCGKVAEAAREWAIENGSNPLMRIALCGYEGEHQMPKDWDIFEWNAGQGFGAQSEERSGNGLRERIWFSPHCARDWFTF